MNAEFSRDTVENPMANEPTLPPAGWYADPEQPQTYRYWTGSEWTDQRAPMALPAVDRRRRVGLIIGGVIAAIGAAAAVFLVLGGTSFDPAAYETIVVGDSEESVIDKLGEPDERQTLGEALGGGDSGLNAEDVGSLLQAAGLEGEENLYWEHDGQQYLVSVAEGDVTGTGDPVPCEKAEAVC
jgi:hypothetical protein